MVAADIVSATPRMTTRLDPFGYQQSCAAEVAECRLMGRRKADVCGSSGRIPADAREE